MHRELLYFLEEVAKCLLMLLSLQLQGLDRLGHLGDLPFKLVYSLVFCVVGLVEGCIRLLE